MIKRQQRTLIHEKQVIQKFQGLQQTAKFLRVVDTNSQKTISKNVCRKIWQYEIDNLQSSKSQKLTTNLDLQVSDQEPIQSSSYFNRNQSESDSECVLIQNSNQCIESYLDSLVQYQNPMQNRNSVVRKLTCLNNIFKQLKLFKQEKLSTEILKQISEIQDIMLKVERKILKNQILR